MFGLRHSERLPFKKVKCSQALGDVQLQQKPGDVLGSITNTQLSECPLSMPSGTNPEQGAFLQLFWMGDHQHTEYLYRNQAAMWKRKDESLREPTS